MSHTPGPWETKPTASLGPQWAVYGDTGRSVAIVYDHDDNTEGNARLIASAPDLLAACKYVFDRMERVKVYGSQERRILREAIQKAEGRI